MKTDVTTPQGIFGMPQHLTVPLYQRPYVWNEDEQWGPLWADIRRIAEHRLGGAGSLATHFLGAVVTQQADAQPVGVQEFLIVDGQQRLTTLQLILDATAAAFSAHELSALTGQLEFLTHNSAMFLGSNKPGLKLRHTNRDRVAFQEVMQADPPIDYASLSHRDSLLVKAHEFFYGRVGKWLEEGPEPSQARAEALSVALQNALELVVIQLGASEDSQEIFETLNARGTPLTAADLIKNFVFQRLKFEGEDEEKAYRELWPFESKFWEAEVSVGRYATTRSAVFLSQWLVSRVGKEISPRSTFTRFKFFVEHESALSMVDLLRLIDSQSEIYRRLTERAADPHADLNRLELHMYRMSVAQVEITKPIVLWLTEPGTDYSQLVVDRVIGMVESWIIRRRLLRLQSSDLGRIAADLVSTGRGVAESDVLDVVERFLSGQQYASTYWPGDDEVVSALATEHFYRRFSQPMQRLLLQAAEDWYRGYTSPGPSKTGVRVFRDKQQVEHLLPRGWRPNWPVDGAADEADRDDHVHRLGNLTLLTGSLNASVSNSEWLGEKGKRAAVDRHDVFLMNRAVVARSAGGWDESLIDERTLELTNAFLHTWPVPAGHEGKVIDRSSRLSKATVSYAHLISGGLLEIGTVLACTDERWPDARCEVLAGGQVLYAGNKYPSPAAAARDVREGKSGNAWYFWRVENGPWLNTLRDRLLNGEGVVSDA
ncbi:GmrSD restriction endonuclease domain-containing protein [Microbacterium sp.]|uniref:GmrSD restriction endonuclease domain-containing protein n=1 Tax=Microbacterium sp. TaxID=51671 RepID=UPI003F6FC802